MNAAPKRPRLTRNPDQVVAIAGQPAAPPVPLPQPPAEPADTGTREAGEAEKDHAQHTAADAGTPEAAPAVPPPPAPAEPIARIVPLAGRPAAPREGGADGTTHEQEATEGVRALSWERVAAAGFSAKRESRSWTPYTPRLPESTWAALEARKLADARRTGDYGIAVSHYLQVAFDGLPRLDGAIDAAAAAQTGLAWLQSSGHPGALVPTGSRIMKTLKTDMQELGLMLKTQQPKVELWIVQAAYVQALLDALEHEPPPDPPAP
jgi:hypothetical protein